MWVGKLLVFREWLGDLTERTTLYRDGREPCRYLGKVLVRRNSNGENYEMADILICSRDRKKGQCWWQCWRHQGGDEEVIRTGSVEVEEYRLCRSF